jgi:hypothetical protein
MAAVFSSPGHRPCELLSWVSVRRPSVPSLAPFCQAVSEEKIFLNSSQSETRIALGGHICWWNGTKWRNFIDDIVQLVKIYLPCNFEVNLITRLGVIALSSSFWAR